MKMTRHTHVNIIINPARLALFAVMAALLVLALYAFAVRTQPRDLPCDLRMDRLICARTSSRPPSLVELTSQQRDEG